MPRLSRRAFLASLLGGAAVGAASGCSQLIDTMVQPDLPDELNPPGGDERHPIAHLLNRAAYGPTPGQIEKVEEMGRERWLDRQLDYKSISDDALGWRLRRYDTLRLNSTDLMSFKSQEDRGYVAGELARTTIVRAVFSERQLYEVMVGFWTDHFSIYHFKDAVAVLKTIDDREVIRPRALGRFRDLLKSSAHSPVMLLYLDNTLNEKSHPNENYAREIMELHSLGVDGGYTERDIQEVARCFTGWTMDDRGRFEFRRDMHDDGEKQVLGHTISAGGGKRDGDKVIDILADHPSTARFVCTKLARRFVADDPPAEIIEACIARWQESGGDIKQVVRTLLTHPQFDEAPPKFKRPFELLVSTLRGVLANYDGDEDLVERLQQMGHRPFNWVSPDGYPDYEAAWSNSLLNYWNLEYLAAHDKLPGVEIDLWEIAEHVGVHRDAGKMLRFFGRLFLKRDFNEVEEEHVRQVVFGGPKLNLDRPGDRDRMLEGLVFLLRSPAYQYR